MSVGLSVLVVHMWNATWKQITIHFHIKEVLELRKKFASGEPNVKLLLCAGFSEVAAESVQAVLE